jgi:hypothetical protein
MADKSKCTSCGSGLNPSLTFNTIVGSGICIPNPSNTDYPKLSFLTSIDRNSIIGQGYLQSVVFNGLN